MLRSLPKFTKESVTAWSRQHRQAFSAAARQLLKSPLTSTLTTLAIAIALALPSALYLMSNDLASVFSQWNSRQITVFLQLEQTDEDLQSMEKQLSQHPDIADIQSMTSSESLARFKEQSDFGSTASLLDENPLPGVITLTPAQTLVTPDQVAALATEIEAMKGVAEVLLDQDWLNKVFTTINGFRQFSVTVLICFGLLVVLVIHNGLRIEVLKKRDEITITKLVGGSNAFIQRPFLYQGLIYGLTGALLALVIVQIILISLSPHFNALAAVYNTSIMLRLPLGFGLTLVFTAILLSLLSTSLSMRAQLLKIRP